MTRQEAKVYSQLPSNELGKINKGFERHYNVIREFADGKEVEIESSLSTWVGVECPVFSVNSNYRVKPAKDAQAACAPKPFYYISKDGGVFFDACSTCSPTQFLFGNCFRTQEEAFAALDRVRAALKGEDSVVKKDLTTENSSVVASEEERSEQREINENEFRFIGKTYVAVEGWGCDNCAFVKTFVCCGNRWKFPPCSAQGRKDGKNVHFVEKGNRNYPPRK